MNSYNLSIIIESNIKAVKCITTPSQIFCYILVYASLA